MRKIDEFRAETSIAKFDSTICTAQWQLCCIHGEKTFRLSIFEGKIDVFCVETSNTSADSTFCTASECYDVFSMKDTISLFSQTHLMR